MDMLIRCWVAFIQAILAYCALIAAKNGLQVPVPVELYCYTSLLASSGVMCNLLMYTRSLSRVFSCQTGVCGIRWPKQCQRPVLRPTNKLPVEIIHQCVFQGVV